MTNRAATNWYVEIPRYGDGAHQPARWRIVCAEGGSAQDEMFKTELFRHENGELVMTDCRYYPFPDEQSCVRFIERNRMRLARV